MRGRSCTEAKEGRLSSFPWFCNGSTEGEEKCGKDVRVIGERFTHTVLFVVNVPLFCPV